MELLMSSADAWLASVLLLCASSLCAAESARRGNPLDHSPICGSPFPNGFQAVVRFFTYAVWVFPCRRFHFYHPTGRITA